LKTRSFILIFLISLAGGFAADNPRQAQTDDIREAVFRYPFEHRGYQQTREPSAYYLAVAEKEENDGKNNGLLPRGNKQHDPSDDFMSRFNDHKLPVHKNSAFQKPTREKPGVRLRITEIKWISDTEVEVKGGHDDFWSASWTTFTVKKEDGKWKVTKAELKRGLVA
jgi:hypothetical protein